MNRHALWIRTARDQRGIALPMAMLLLVSLGSLMLAFSVLAQSEPLIASNHQHAAQAIAMASSGVERVAWALENASDPNGIPASPETAVAPYNGGTFFTLSALGGFTAQVTAGASAGERTVTAIGWSPSNTAANRAHRKVQVTLLGPVPPLNPPCAICVAGSTEIGGNARVESRNNGCNGGTPPAAAVQSAQTTTISGSGDVFGYGNSTRNEAGADYTNGADPNQFLYTQANIDRLKQMAKDNGTYYQGAVTSIPTTGGVIFIDTVDGSNFTNSTSDSNAGSLHLTSNQTHPGIIVVAGSIHLAGTATFNGLVYALNDITVTGNVTVNGALASENRKDTSSTNIDSTSLGSVSINYHCANVANGGGTVNLGTAWTRKSGSYFEQPGS